MESLITKLAGLLKDDRTKGSSLQCKSRKQCLQISDRDVSGRSGADRALCGGALVSVPMEHSEYGYMGATFG